MKKSIIIFCSTLVVMLPSLAQKTHLPSPSIAVGGELSVFIVAAGPQATALFPVKEGLSFAANANYDLFFATKKHYNYGNRNSGITNFSAGLRFGDIQDIYAQLAFGYAFVSNNYILYMKPGNTRSPSIAISGGYVLADNIDLGGEIYYLGFQKGYTGNVLFKLKVAYVFRFKKQVR